MRAAYHSLSSHTSHRAACGGVMRPVRYFATCPACDYAVSGHAVGYAVSGYAVSGYVVYACAVSGYAVYACAVCGCEVCGHETNSTRSMYQRRSIHSHGLSMSRRDLSTFVHYHGRRRESSCTAHRTGHEPD